MEEYLNTLTKYEKPKTTWDNLDNASAAELFYDPQSSVVLHERLMSDCDSIEVYKAWIQDNKHLIEVSTARFLQSSIKLEKICVFENVFLRRERQYSMLDAVLAFYRCLLRKLELLE